MTRLSLIVPGLAVGLWACGGGHTAGPSRPVTISLEGAPATVSADVGTLAVSFRLLDRLDRDIPGLKPTASVAPRGTVLEVREVEAGYQAAVADLTTTGKVTLTVRNEPLYTTHTIEVLAGAPDTQASVFVASPASVPADGVSTATATVRPKDRHANAVGVGRTVAITATAGATVSIVRDVGDGSYTATVSHTAVESVALVATVDGVVLAAQPTVIFTSTAISLKLQGGATVEAGRTVDFIASVKSGALPAPGRQVGFELAAGSSASLGAVRELSPGTYAASFVDEKVESLAITARDVISGASDTLTVQVVAAPASVLTLLPQKPSVTADEGQVGLVASISDRFGNPLSGLRPTFSTTQGSVGVAADNGNGNYATTVFGLRRAERVSATVALGTMKQSVNLDVLPGAVSAGMSTVLVPKGTIANDGVTPANVVVVPLDAYLNRLGTGQALGATATGSAQVPPATGAGDGSYQIAVTDRTAETVTLTIVVNGVTLAARPTLTFGTP